MKKKKKNAAKRFTKNSEKFLHVNDSVRWKMCLWDRRSFASKEQMEYDVKIKKKRNKKGDAQCKKKRKNLQRKKNHGVVRQK